MASELDLRTEREVTNQTGADKPPCTPGLGRSQSSHYLLLRWNDLPNWRQDNEYLLSGYRPSSGSFRKSLNGLQHIHNETVNIYSHLLGAALFATLSICVYIEIRNHHIAIQGGDVLVFGTFFLGVVLCFSFSGLFHILSNHSKEVAAFWNQLDYLGIVILMWGSTVPSIYYGFYCNPNLQRLYWAVVSVLAVACAAAVLAPRAPLKGFYRDESERLFQGGANTVGKQNFTSLYSPAREMAFTKRNITKAWAACGLFPLNPDKSPQGDTEAPSSIHCSEGR